jgi:hypothetical protein
MIQTSLFHSALVPVACQVTMFCSLTCRHNFITQNALHLKKINRLRKPKVSISNLHPTFNPYFVGNERRFSKQNSTESTSTYSEIKHTKRKIALWYDFVHSLKIKREPPLPPPPPRVKVRD